MEKSIAEQLKEHLDSISANDFAKEWAVIEAMDLVGPSAKNFLQSWDMHNLQMVELDAPPGQATKNILIPKKLTPDYRSLSFFSNLVA